MICIWKTVKGALRISSEESLDEFWFPGLGGQKGMDAATELTPRVLLSIVDDWLPGYGPDKCRAEDIKDLA